MIPLDRNNALLQYAAIDGKKQGEATEISSDGSVLKFTYVDGKRQGEATQTYSDGCVLKYTYVDGKAQGEATQTSSNGNVLKYTYVDGKAQGEATQTSSDGTVLKFTYVDDERQGEATTTYSDGSVLKFTFVDDKKQGEATEISSDGSVLKFTFVDDKKQGEATQTYSDGGVLKYTYVDGKEQGEATQTSNDGSVLKYTYVDGKEQGEATRTSSDGSVLKYTYVDGKEQGEATRTYSDGKVLKFTYVDGKAVSFLFLKIPKVETKNSDEQIALSTCATHLALDTLRNVLPVLVSVTDNTSDILAWTATCKTLAFDRWEAMARDAKTISALFTKAFIVDAKASRNLSFGVALGRDLILSLFPGLAHLCNVENLSNVGNIVRLFQRATYETELSLIMPQIDGCRYSPKSEDLTVILKKFPKTRRIDLYENFLFLEGECKAILGLCPNLQHLKIRKEIGPSHQSWNVSFPKTLKSVDLGSLKEPIVTTESVQQLISECSELEEICLYEWKKPPGWSFTAIANTLKMINLSNSNIDDSDLSQITTACPQLTSLSLRSCQLITAQGFQNASFSPSLRVLELGSTKIDDMGLSRVLGICTALEDLSINSCHRLTSQAFMGSFPPTLKRLGLYGTNIDDKGLHNVLERCSQLEGLYLMECENITASGLAKAPFPESLKILDIRGTPDFGFSEDKYLEFQTNIIVNCPLLQWRR